MSALAERYGRETALGQAIQVAEMSAWLYSYWPLLEAAQDEPKTLEELRRAAETWRAGYDIHHLVERATAKNASERLRVEQPDNRLSIPRFKHWELNRWYETGNPLFGGQTPRAYARNQEWEERERVGLMGLRQVGVLKP